jgi:L-threonylcarbamoyladenylate synthase
MIIRYSEMLKEDLRGKLIIFPTDTVYGVGCLYDDLEAIERIYWLKERDFSKPLAVLAGDMNQVATLVQMNDDIIRLGNIHWPGALTLVGSKTKVVPDLATSHRQTVGIRIPNHEIALGLLRHFGPIVTTSINRSTEPALVRFRDVLTYKGQVDYVIDGGDLSGEPSTVFDTLTHSVLRQGSVIISE